MRNAIYNGIVTHQRYTPIEHHLSYPISMFFLSLDDLYNNKINFRFFSKDKFNFLSFDAKKYLSPEEINLLLKRNGYLEQYNIYILTHLSYLGYCYNPVSFYYCYDDNDVLTLILAEIHNTPWGERYTYVLDYSAYDSDGFNFFKQFHISPFAPMDTLYRWKFNSPDDIIDVDMENIHAGQKMFNAKMRLHRQVLSQANVNKYIIKYPFVTQRILWRIYWNALLLWIKGAKFYTHPGK